MATEISAIISWHDVLHPGIGGTGKWYCRVGFVDDGERTPTETERVFHFIIDPGLPGAIFVVFGYRPSRPGGSRGQETTVDPVQYQSTLPYRKYRRYLARYRVSFKGIAIL